MRYRFPLFYVLPLFRSAWHGTYPSLRLLPVSRRTCSVAFLFPEKMTLLRPHKRGGQPCTCTPSFFTNHTFLYCHKMYRNAIMGILISSVFRSISAMFFFSLFCIFAKKMLSGRRLESGIYKGAKCKIPPRLSCPGGIFGLRFCFYLSISLSLLRNNIRERSNIFSLCSASIVL